MTAGQILRAGVYWLGWCLWWLVLMPIVWVMYVLIMIPVWLVRIFWH